MQAEKGLRSQRLGWLHLESMHRILQEIVQEHGFREHHSTAAPAEDTVGSGPCGPHNHSVTVKNTYDVNVLDWILDSNI